MMNWLNGDMGPKEAKELGQKLIWKIWRKKLAVLGLAALGAGVAVNGVWLFPAKYNAQLMLAVEEGETSGWQNLLAQFGLDVGGLNPGGIFEGESLVQLFQTRYMVERTLLQKAEFNEDSVLLINFLYPYTEWGQDAEFADVTFSEDRSTFTPLQDSLLNEVHQFVNKEILDVYKPDKKLSLIFVNSVHENKYFAKAFTEAVVKNTTEFFLESITSKARVNLQVLQLQKDSAELALKQAIIRNASAQDQSINSIFQRSQVEKYASYVDLEIANALFIEITKNLTLAEIGLRKQTPLIQVVERPIFPLNRTGMLWWEWMLAGAALGAAFGVYRALVQSEKA